MSKTLYSIRRDLDIVMEALQGLEQLSSDCVEGGAKEVGAVMVPLNLYLERVLRDLDLHYENSGGSEHFVSTGVKRSLDFRVVNIAEKPEEGG